MTLATFLAGSFLALVMASGLFLALFTAIMLIFAAVYGRTRGPDPLPVRRFDDGERPPVSVQLPIRNEGLLSERIIRGAAALDYPADRLQIQVLDDSDDRTSELIDRVVDQVRRERPSLDITTIRRGTREGFKAGNLSNGVKTASGEYFAIFDVDSIIPPDFLARTIHYFTDSCVGVVQARAGHLNREHSALTRFQAVKTDVHQMFDQTARARLGWWTHFHGTAGIIRREAIESSGGWQCVSEVEDVELSVRMFLKGWTTIYLDRLRVASELPETMSGFLTQQMRWKRGWIRVLTHYGAAIFQGSGSVLPRLDIIGRLLNSLGSAAVMPVTFGALPAFVIAERLGLWWPLSLVYALLLAAAVCMRLVERRLIEEPPPQGPPDPLRWLRMFLPTGLILNLGLSPALTQGVLEAFGSGRQWEVTPKSGSLASTSISPLPSYVIITLASAVASLALLLVSFGLGYFIAAIFYLMMTIGTAWVAGACLRERAQRRAVRLRSA